MAKATARLCFTAADTLKCPVEWPDAVWLLNGEDLSLVGPGSRGGGCPSPARVQGAWTGRQQGGGGKQTLIQEIWGGKLVLRRIRDSALAGPQDTVLTCPLRGIIQIPIGRISPRVCRRKDAFFTLVPRNEGESSIMQLEIPCH